MFRPENGARRDTVNPDIGPQLKRQGMRHHGQPGLGHAINRVAGHGPLGMDIHDIDDRCARGTQFRQQRLNEEKGSAQIAADEVIPVLARHLPHRGGVEAGGIVDQNVESICFCPHGISDLFRRRRVSQVSLQAERAVWPILVQRTDQLVRRFLAAVIVQPDAAASGMKRPDHFRTDALCRPRDQHIPGSGHYRIAH